jgi:hypothetical protein
MDDDRLVAFIDQRIEQQNEGAALAGRQVASREAVRCCRAPIRRRLPGPPEFTWVATGR